MDDSSDKHSFNSAAVITGYSQLCLFKQVRMKLLIFLGLLDPSFLTRIMSSLVLMTTFIICGLVMLKTGSKNAGA
jgi:hypothetical protein